MRVELADSAKLDIAEIQEYLSDHLPQFLESTLLQIRQGIDRIARMPQIGRPGLHVTTRYWSLSPLPYIVHYKICEEFILVTDVRHAARRWPPGDDE